MVAKIVTIMNQKGGSGKTTLCMQLAGALAWYNKEVLVIDADPQNTAVRWSSCAEEESPFPATVVSLSGAGSKLHLEVQKSVGKYDYIIIDCPPAIESEAPQSALVVSDLAIIPMIPSPADIWATKGIQQLINLVLPVNPNLKALIVPNQCQVHTNLAKDILELLSTFDIPVAQTFIRQRTIYRESSLHGQTVYFLGSKAKDAIVEVGKLLKEVIDLLIQPGSKLTDDEKDKQVA